jgi:hypothetical protein
MSSQEKAMQMRRQGMINRVGCIAIALAVFLVIVIGLSITNSGLQKKYGEVESEFSNLKEELANGLDTPRLLGRYMSSRSEGIAYDEKLDVLAQRVETAQTLPELDAIFREFKVIAEEVREKVPLDTRDNDQGARNQEAELLGAYRRYGIQRGIFLEKAAIYNSALSGFPNNIVGSIFGMKEVPLGEPPAEDKENSSHNTDEEN